MWLYSYRRWDVQHIHRSHGEVLALKSIDKALTAANGQWRLQLIFLLLTYIREVRNKVNIVDNLDDVAIQVCSKP